VAALVALAFAAVPRWRWALRHVALASAIIAAAAVQLAAMTGDTLAASESPVNQLVRIHEAWAGRLQFATWVLAAAVVIAWVAVPHTSPIPNHSRAAPDPLAVPMLQRAVLVVVAVVAIATLVLVVLTGHAGARAVWAG